MDTIDSTQLDLFSQCVRAEVKEIPLSIGGSSLMLCRSVLSPEVLLESKWLNGVGGEPPDFWKVSTYTECEEYTIDVAAQKLCIHFWHGSLFDCSRHSPMCKWVFAITPALLGSEWVKTGMNHALRQRAEWLFESEEQQRRNNRIDAILQSFKVSE